jgi:hypothetical protein
MSRYARLQLRSGERQQHASSALRQSCIDKTEAVGLSQPVLPSPRLADIQEQIFPRTALNLRRLLI